MSEKSPEKQSSVQTSLWEDSRVPDSVQPVARRDSRTSAPGYGESSFELLAMYDPESISSWRTWQRSFVGNGWEPFSPISWPRAGWVDASGTAYRLRPSVPRSRGRAGTGSSLWPSPTASDASGRGYHGSLRGNWWAALPGAIALSLGYPVQHPITGKIHPEFVEWLMGFQIGHTESGASETQ